MIRLTRVAKRNGWLFALGLASVLLAGCQTSEPLIAREYLEDDHVANYRRVFDLPPREDVDVLNSIVIAYGRKPGIITTDDWLFELVVPASWIERTARLMHLARAEDVNHAVAAINERKQMPLRDWYAPKPVSEYKLYYLSVTSVPYVHMLVESESQPDGRYRVFISKQSG